MPSHVDLINWIPTAVSVGALGIIYWDIRRFKIETRKDTAELRKEMKTSLYTTSGTTKYIPRGECTEREGSYHDTVCKKIDALAASQRDAETKRDSARTSNETRLSGIEQNIAKMSVVQKFVLHKQGLLPSDVNLE